MSGFFPSTRSSALLGAISDDEGVRRRSWDRLARAYHRSIYQHVRLRWNKRPEDAADLTQAFFERCLSRDVVELYDASRARFRTYLRLRIDRFVADRARAEGAVARGGRTQHAFDFDSLEGELAMRDPSADPEQMFEEAWTRSVLAMALDALRTFCAEKGKREHLTAFERFHVGATETSHEALAAELGLDVETLNHRLAYARRHYRRLVIETLEEMTSSDEELRDEVQRILGAEL